MAATLAEPTDVAAGVNRLSPWSGTGWLAGMEISSGSAVLAAESAGIGPDVLLVHAGVTDQRSWSHVVGVLPDRRCLTYDARGYGRTTYEPEDGWSSVDDALAVLDAYDSAQAVVIAASMGGRTALDLTLLHPDRVRALVLIGPAISGAPEATYEPEVLALDEEWEEAEERGDLATVNRLEARVWLDGPAAAEGRVAGEIRDLFLDMNGRALDADDPGERREDVAAWDRLTEVAVPTLLLVGDLDLQYIRHGVAHAAASIPGARAVELPGVAHLPHLEGDERTLTEIAAFVASV
jgi:pimeloyl-ACP methyl ester carboxylesterase